MTMTPAKFLSTACPQTLAAAGMIPVERLTTGTLIDVPCFGPAEVYHIAFDGEGYTVTYCTNDRRGWDATDTVYVLAGGAVEHAGRGEPSLKPLTLNDVTSMVCADILVGPLGSYGKRVA